jgi:hypoxanthine phosphoribosyltransferase
MGDLENVRRYLSNLHLDLDFDVVDNDLNTDLMLAIIRGGATKWGRIIGRFLTSSYGVETEIGICET